MNKALSLKRRLFNSLVRFPWPINSIVETLHIKRDEAVLESEVLEDIFITIGYPRTSQLWEKRLSTVGGHERGICEWLAKNLRKQDIIFDVGAHFGFYPQFISAIQPDTIIHAFEPNPVFYAYLKRNKKRCTQGINWLLVNKMVSNCMNKNSVKLDEYSNIHNIIPTIVKVDIEGAEILLLEGSKNLIESKKTIFLIEVHTNLLKEINSSVNNVLKFFDDEYQLKVLSNLRDYKSILWSNDLSLLDNDDHTYLYAAPKALEREF